jgi:hypothetical protein
VMTTDGKTPFAVICENEACERFGDPFNEFAVPTVWVEAFCVAFGQGAEDPADHCPSCGVLGVLSELDQPACACGYCSDEADRVAGLPVRKQPE